MARIQQASFSAGTIDSELLSQAMLIEPQIYRDIVLERYAPTTPLMAMAELFGSQMSSESTYDTELYTWGILGPPRLSSQIISTTGTPKMNNTWEMELTKDAWYQKGAVLKLEDDHNSILLASDAIETSKGFSYKVQVKGQNPEFILPSELIATGKYVTFETTNYWEGSDRGHPIPFVTPNKLVNAGSITRTDHDITGTALTTGILYENVKVTDNGKAKYRGFLPMGVTGDGKLHLDFHMMQTEAGLMSNAANFDPTTGKIYNSVDGKKTLSGDGFERQMEGGHTIWYHPNDRPAEVTAKLERFVTHRAMSDTLDTMDQLVMGGSGLQSVLHHTYRDFLVKTGEQVHINVGPDKKVKVGLRMDTFVTPKGEIKFVYNGYFDRGSGGDGIGSGSGGRKVKQITYRGIAYPISSFRGYFMPIRQLTNAKGEAIPSIQVMSRFKNGISRNLVPGTIPGMSGLVQKMGRGTEKFRASYDNYTKVATGRDGETFMFLSEKMIIVHNPTEFARLMPLY